MKSILVIFILLFTTTVSATSKDCFDISVFIEANGDSDESRLEELEKLQTGIRRFFAVKNGVGEIPSVIALSEAEELITFLTDHEGFTIADIYYDEHKKELDRWWLGRKVGGVAVGIGTAVAIMAVTSGGIALTLRFSSTQFFADNFLGVQLARIMGSAAGGIFVGNKVATTNCSLPEELQ